MSTNITNYNLSTINCLSSINNTLSNITINNSIKIPKSANSTNIKDANLNAGILIKDINSSNGAGEFYMLNVNSSLNGKPYLYFNKNEIIDSTNILSTVENILQDYPLETSNIIVQGGYINFGNSSNGSNGSNGINSDSQNNIILGSNGVGLRYSDKNTMQFKNYNTDWIEFSDVATRDQFSELLDVDTHTNPLQNNQYITYNSISEKFVNSNLSLLIDKNPTLGGNLNIGNNLLRFNNTTNRLVFNSNGIIDNNLLVLKNNTSISNNVNYLEINNNTYDKNPGIIASSSILGNDVGMTLETTGSGNIELNASRGGVYVNADSLIISGFIKNSIYRTSTHPSGYLPLTPYNVPLTNDTILFDFNKDSPVGTYWANIGGGVDGQKLTLIFNNTNISNSINQINQINVIVNFRTNGIISPSGYSTGLYFNTIGQNATLIYLDDGVYTWQLLNNNSGGLF
jgi:hypothetical protein